jgi:ABC-type transporter Mla MlaB component
VTCTAFLQRFQAMLRITIMDSADSRTLKLEGKLAGPWVAELARVWQARSDWASLKRLQIDLRGLDFVDAQGSRLLREIFYETKACFLANSPLTQYFADLATRKAGPVGEKGDYYARSLRI